jgi:hypothetical protein
MRGWVKLQTAPSRDGRAPAPQRRPRGRGAAHEEEAPAVSNVEDVVADWTPRGEAHTGLQGARTLLRTICCAAFARAQAQ